MTLARANIEPEAWTDPRFLLLAKYCGFGPGEAGREVAIVRCAKMWAWQTAKYTPDAPTYVVDAAIIESFLAVDNAVEAMVKSGLAEELPEGFRIKGSVGKIEWLWKLGENGKKGGEATKQKWDRAKHPTEKKKRSRTNKTGPSALAAARADAPALPGILDLDLDLSQRASEPARARDPAESALPSTEHGTAAYMAPEHPHRHRDTKPGNVIAIDPRVRQREAILREIPQLHASSYNRARAELGSNVRAMNVVGDPAERALRALLDDTAVLDGMLEECRRVVELRYEEALDKRTLQYFGPVMWSRACFDKAATMTLAEARRARASPAPATSARSPPRGTSALSSLLDTTRYGGTT